MVERRSVHYEIMRCLQRKEKHREILQQGRRDCNKGKEIALTHNVEIPPQRHQPLPQNEMYAVDFIYRRLVMLWT